MYLYTMYDVGRPFRVRGEGHRARREFFAAVEAWRIARGLSDEAMASRLGMHRSTYQRIRRGEPGYQVTDRVVLAAATVDEALRARAVTLLFGRNLDLSRGGGVLGHAAAEDGARMNDD
ncbi:MAG: helix-turn-helix transcriptional regulator [Dehalococcoidia bacterium]